jgi:hypothetical protein
MFYFFSGKSEEIFFYLTTDRHRLIWNRLTTFNLSKPSLAYPSALPQERTGDRLRRTAKKGRGYHPFKGVLSHGAVSGPHLRMTPKKVVKGLLRPGRLPRGRWPYRARTRQRTGPSELPAPTEAGNRPSRRSKKRARPACPFLFNLLGRSPRERLTYFAFP